MSAAEIFPKLNEICEQIEEVADLLHALDKVGDGIGGADGYAVSAVALNAKSVADNALDILRSLHIEKKAWASPDGLPDHLFKPIELPPSEARA